MEFSVYLGGPITGESHAECTGWREDVAKALHGTYSTQHHTIHSLSPLRHKDYLLGKTTLEDSYEDILLSSQRGIYTRDRFDCLRCDLFFVNVLGAVTPSLGTVMEIAWADSADIPIVLVMEDEGNLHEHAMIREACPFRVNNIHDALVLTRNLLLP